MSDILNHSYSNVPCRIEVGWNRRLRFHWRAIKRQLNWFNYKAFSLLTGRMSLEMMKGQIQEIQGLNVSWKRKESGELKIARWVRGGRKSKWKSLEENLGQCVCIHLRMMTGYSIWVKILEVDGTIKVKL